MSRIHPAESKADAAPAAAHECPSVWTVWKKSSMGFQGTDGFSIFDDHGRLAFRVDNYSRRRKLFAGELVLMDGFGMPLLSLRPQILSLHDSWNGYCSEGNSNEAARSCLFSMRRRSLLHSNDEAKVYLKTPKSKKNEEPRYKVEGCFWKRNCKITLNNGEEVAHLARKKVGPSTFLGEDVFSLVIQPGVDCALIMALIIIMDRICCKPFAPFLCSS